jgi:hypothetical protein
MLTKIVTAALALIVALMLLRFLSGRAHRAELRLRAEARRRREEADAEAARQAEHRPRRPSPGWSPSKSIPTASTAPRASGRRPGLTGGSAAP